MGQRVLTRGSQDRQPAPASGTTEGDDDEDDPYSTKIDPATWRLVRLEVENIWPNGTVDRFEIITLQPAAWLEQNQAEVGAMVSAPLDMAEMGLPDLPARVVAIEPCPTIEPGPGRVVLTTVNHLNTYIWELTVEDNEGVTETLQPTGWHRFYSTSREDWLPTNELAVGEQLRSRQGEVTVVSLAHRPGTERVYNLTVEADHVYYVGGSGVLAHNNCGVPREGRYEFPDQTADNIPYVGQSGNMPERLNSHAQAGRLKPGTETTTEVVGGKTAREVSEHKRIQELTGGAPARQSDAVANKKDPIGPKRQHLLDEE